MCPSLPLPNQRLSLGILQDVVPLGVDGEVDRNVAGIPFFPAEELVSLGEEALLEELLSGVVWVQINQLRHPIE